MSYTWMASSWFHSFAYSDRVEGSTATLKMVGNEAVVR
jgi:hypothetical protein